MRICVFCGSSPGRRPAYLEAARRLAVLFAERGIGLVYGGASVGLMGELARTLLARGGEVTGVIPRALVEREVALAELPDLRVVGSMHERKALMADLADGFIALPGGFGTLEEYFEVLTWAQLGLHGKPMGLLDVEGYYQPLLGFLARAHDEGFVRPRHLELLLSDPDPETLLARMARFRAPPVERWIAPGET